MLRKLSAKEQFDIRTMRYFIPRNKYKTRITKQAEAAMADLSSKGIQPQYRSKGFLNLLWGKTYRDLQITQWKDDVREGLITKYEIYSSLPKWLQPWAESKLKDVPYNASAYEEIRDDGGELIGLVHVGNSIERILMKGLK